jgi:hypothetical protein
MVRVRSLKIAGVVSNERRASHPKWNAARMTAERMTSVEI